MNKLLEFKQILKSDKGLFLLLALLIVLPLVIMAATSKKNISVRKSFADSSSFTFTVAGDYGANPKTAATLQGIAGSQANFNLAIGDFSYREVTPETSWCSYVKSYVGDTFPFELVSGNHETDEQDDGEIDNFIQCLPDKMTSVGAYAKEYYFDYPQASPTARFINLSPNLHFSDGTYQYSLGSTHYNWASDAIDQARASGIKWLIVTSHENCISLGGTQCQIGKDLFDLLISKKVDLVLQGHDHNYQRSKQLATNSNCLSVPILANNQNCVVDDGQDGSYTKDAGTVFAIVGTGGIGLSPTNMIDAEAKYFSKWMGANSNPRQGFLKVDVSDSALSASFIGSTSTSNFSDVFNITTASQSSPLVNLLENGSFENVGNVWLEPWTFKVSSPAVATVSQDASASSNGGASAKVDINSTSSDWHVQLQQSAVPLTAGKTHTFSFSAKASSPRSVSVTVQKSASPYTVYFQQSVALTTSWQQFSLPFTPSVTDSSLAAFNLAQTAGQVWIDNASISTPSQSGNPTITPSLTPSPSPSPTPSLTPSPSPSPAPLLNLVNNPSFENTGGSWLNPWLFKVTSPAAATASQDGTTKSKGINSFKANITNASASDWHAQLQQTNITLVAGKAYTITFDAKASVARSIGLTIQKAASPYTTYLNQTINITSSWQPYSISFTPTVSGNMLAAFNLAKALGQVNLDNLSITAP